MESKIQVGEYVRTKHFGIARCIKIFGEKKQLFLFDKLDEECWSGDLENVLFECDLEKVIKKHSFNIIDLIEEGDYVNGNEIALEAPNPDPLCDPIYGYFDRYGELVGIIENEDIKSIVTKEQFKSIEYEV